ncbi:ferredoxin family protein [Pontiellaceae bacterium B1224]|nr:ferredoxin family protein [Pontiellaceae bacterium B1224]
MAVSCIDENKCMGCGICVESCPMDVLRLDKTKKRAVIAYPEDCQVCHLCQHFCPTGAIEVTQGQPREMLYAFDTVILGPTGGSK